MEEAVNYLGLDTVESFHPRDRILESVLSSHLTST
jgi:hypothetical protein